jgi:homoserine O-acetyltransferase/O-succinyltransferase
MSRLPPAPLMCLAVLFSLYGGPARALQTTPGDQAAHHRFVLPSFTFEDGTTLANAVVSYGTYGHPNAGRDNAILLPSSYMADHHDNDWLIGPGQALDTTRWFLVATELFGNGHSSSPSNTPEPHHGPRFPAPPSATMSKPSTGCWWTSCMCGGWLR